MFKVLAVVATALLVPAVAQAAQRDNGPAAAQVAAQICANLQQQLGSTFASTYGSVDQCGQQLAGQAQALVDGCTAKGQPGTDVYRQCIQSGIADAVHKITGTNGTVTVTPSAAAVVADICNDLHGALGATCAAKLTAKAQSIIDGCVAKAQPGTSAFSACMDTAIDAAVKAQRNTIAKQACASLQHKLGKKAFAKKYGSLAKCQAKKAGG